MLLLCCINLWIQFIKQFPVSQLSVSLSRSVYFFSFHNSFSCKPIKLVSFQRMRDRNTINVDLTMHKSEPAMNN